MPVAGMDAAGTRESKRKEHDINGSIKVLALAADLTPGNRRASRTCAADSPALGSGGLSALEHLLEIPQAPLVDALDQLDGAGVTLGFGRVVGRILALEVTGPGHDGGTVLSFLERYRRLIVRQRQRRLDDPILIRVLLLVERQQLFSEGRAVLDGE